MRIYEINLYISNQNLQQENKVLNCNTLKLSQFLGKELQYKIDFGIIKDNTEYIIIAHALNPLGIGIVPYEYIYQKKGFIDTTRNGFTDITTPNIIYINIHIPNQAVQRVALHEFPHVLKFKYPLIYNAFIDTLKQDELYTNFCKSDLNIKALENSGYPKEMYEDESLSNFYTINPDNNEIPLAFFYKLNYTNSKVSLPTKPFNQQKYFDILWNTVERISFSK